MDISSTPPHSSSAHPPVCVFTGSSVCAGWSGKDNYGWAQRLADHLVADGWQVHNVAKPGADARLTIDRFYQHVAPKEPTLVIIGLGLWNERINQRGRKAALNLLSGLIEIVAMCRGIGAHVMLGGVYPNQRYTVKEYTLLKEVHEELKSWKSKYSIDVFDFMTNLDDGTGKWQEGLYADFIHPNDKGHELMYHNIDLNLFENKKAKSWPFAKL